jgi:DNA-binding MarR family transcriptional regulator
MNNYTFEKSMEKLIVGIYRDLELLEKRMVKAGSLNIGISEMHMLDAIREKSDANGATISELSDFLGIRMPSVTAAVNKLEGKGFVQRCKCEEDKRIVYVRLTQKGERAEVAHRYFHRTLTRAVAKELSDTEKEALIIGVTKMDLFLKDNLKNFAIN